MSMAGTSVKSWIYALIRHARRFGNEAARDIAARPDALDLICLDGLSRLQLRRCACWQLCDQYPERWRGHVPNLQGAPMRAVPLREHHGGLESTQ